MPRRVAARPAPEPDPVAHADDTSDAGPALERSGAAELSEAQRRSARTAMDGGGAYVRDEAGVWHDARDGTEVVGARDLRLGDLFDPSTSEVDGVAVRVVPRAWASRHPDHPLAWVFEHADLGSREPIAIPADVWDERATSVVGMDAPELHPVNLVGPDGVADLLGVTAGTVRAYLARGQMPAPIARLGGSPVWPRALVERWMRSRRAGTAPNR